MTTAVREVDPRVATEAIATNPGITLVDFTAEWCAPCRAIGPVLEKLAAETEDLTVLKVDVDAAPEFAATYDVMSFPTLIFFVDGQPVHRHVGARGFVFLREELERVRTAVAAAES
ncbi:MAG: thioredoxin family protein [Acidimicrobiia bacterium]